MKYTFRNIVFELIQECNLSCLYCYNYWRRDGHINREYRYLDSHRTLNKLLKSVHFENITFTGGEPFLAEGFLDLVLKCRMKGKGVTIITNGTTGSIDEYDLLSKMGVSLFELPLHSYIPEIHDRLTGSRGSFKRVIMSIHNLAEYKAELCIAIVLTKLNINTFTETLHFIKELGIKRIMLARFNIGGRGIGNIDVLLPTRQELVSAFSIANNFVRSNKIKITANVCVPYCIISTDDFPKIPISSCGSSLAHKPVTIDSFGNVRICNHSPHIMGNIHSDEIQSIFKSEYTQKWETQFPQFCSGCNFWKRCKGGCRAASEQMGYSIDCEDPIIGYLTNGKPVHQNLEH